MKRYCAGFLRPSGPAACLLILVVTGLLSACLVPQRQQIRTLADMETRVTAAGGDHGEAAQDPAPPGKEALPADRRRALEQYRAFLAAQARPAPDGPSDIPLAREARRRLADLQLELRLAGDLSGNLAGDDMTVSPADAPAGLDEAIRIYEDLLATYPGQPGEDRILYQLARAYDESGRSEAALATLDRLVAGHPASHHAPEAHFRRAEMRFLQGDYAGAARAYEAVLAYGATTPFLRQARYKYGWSLFKLEDYQRALDAFFVILETLLGKEDGDRDDALARAHQALVADTLRVTSLTFSYLGGSDAIDRYLDGRAAVSYAHRLYAGLGEFYLDKARFHDAARAFRAFARREPLHARAPAFLVRAITAFERGGFPTRVLAARTDFAQRYALDRPFWRHHAPEALPGIVAYLKDTLATLARHHHARAQRSRTKRDYDAAIHWYRRYLDNFPADADAPAQHYLLAEALFESGRFEAAARAYEQVAYDYAPTPQGAKAAHAALVAHAREAERRRQQGDTEAGRRWQRRTLASGLRLADRYPRHPQAAPALAKAAEDYFALGERDAATVAARRLLALPGTPPAPLRLSAWLVLGHSAFDRRDFPRAEAAYRQALTLAGRGARRRAAIEDRLGASIYKQGESLRAAGDLAGAAAQFLRVAEAAPASQIRPTAEYDAAAALIALRRWPRAIRILEDFRRRLPDHPLAREIPVKLATAYEENGQGLAAARELERIAEDPQGEAALRREALWRAAELYAGAGEASRAASAYKRYLDAFPQPFALALEALQRLADLNHQVGNQRRRHYWLRRLIEADARAGAARTERSRHLAARAALILAEPLRSAFRAVRLDLPLDRHLKLKKARMEAALDAYQRAAAYGVAEVTTAATYGIAEIYHDFSRALLESQRPPDLSAEALEQYDILLEEQAYPFEEEAIALHETNSARAAQGIYDHWVRASFKALAALMPVRYAKKERSIPLARTY